MKYTLYILVISLFVTIAGCNKESHDTECGAVPALTEQKNDAVNDIHLWVYDHNGKEMSQHSYSSYTEVAATLLPLPAGEYTFVVATNLTEPFKVQKGTAAATDLENLYVKLNGPSASPAHAHYAVQHTTVSAEGITRVPLAMNRVMTEMGFTIKNVPAEVVKATLQITNAAEGFYPGIRKLSPQTALVSLGEQYPADGVLSFPMKQIMPVIMPMNRSGEATPKTLLQLTLTYITGDTHIFDLEAPATQNGNTYMPEIEYSILRLGVTIEINAINGWVELPPISGEVLNPTT